MIRVQPARVPQAAKSLSPNCGTSRKVSISRISRPIRSHFHGSVRRDEQFETVLQQQVTEFDELFLFTAADPATIDPVDDFMKPG